ncbi:hypothetical protein [Streptomyces sp. NPDC050982]|uniref:hypothetical protein n=1 Tax=Streptomyces sp. NPDC050982 TaxID=3154746 RepID=UPI0033C1C299
MGLPTCSDATSRAPGTWPWTARPLAACLSPEMAALAAWLEALITEQADTGQGLLRLPGAEEDGAEAFMQAWVGHLHDLTDRARARRTGAEETSGRPATP